MKKLSLFTLCVIFSMFFIVSCGDESDEFYSSDRLHDSSENNGESLDDSDNTEAEISEGDKTDTSSNGDDEDGVDTQSETDPTNPDDPTEPTDPTNPTEPTDPTNPTDPTEPTNPGEGSDGNLNTGDTSGNQAQNGAVGAACTSDSQCTGTYSGSYGGESYDVEAFCLTANDSYFPAPGGYCTFNCDSTDHQACDSAGEVYHGYNGWGDGYCFHRCTKPSDCRVGYRCSNKIHACLPDCATAGCETGTGIAVF